MPMRVYFLFSVGLHALVFFIRPPITSAPITIDLVQTSQPKISPNTVKSKNFGKKVITKDSVQKPTAGSGESVEKYQQPIDLKDEVLHYYLKNLRQKIYFKLSTASGIDLKSQSVEIKFLLNTSGFIETVIVDSGTPITIAKRITKALNQIQTIGMLPKEISLNSVWIQITLKNSTQKIADL